MQRATIEVYVSDREEPLKFEAHAPTIVEGRLVLTAARDVSSGRELKRVQINSGSWVMYLEEVPGDDDK